MRHLSLFLGLNLCFALLAAQKVSLRIILLLMSVCSMRRSRMSAAKSCSEIHGVGIQQENILD